MERVLLAPRFKFGQDDAHSGERAARCDPPVFAAAGGKMSLQVEHGRHICTSHVVQKKKAMRKMLVAKGVVQKEVSVLLPCFSHAGFSFPSAQQA
jgi:hypothetical protein